MIKSIEEHRKRLRTKSDQWPILLNAIILSDW